MNITQFKKEIKGISSGKKKQKAVQHQEYILSGTSDAVGPYNTVIVVIPSYPKEFEVVTDRNKPIAHIVKSLDVLTDQNILGKVATVYGLNYLFTMDKKQICTFNRRYEKHVPQNEYDAFKEVDAFLKIYFKLKRHYKKLIEDEYGKITQENRRQLQQIAKERGYVQIIVSASNNYKNELEKFINMYEYNPHNYNLKLII